MGLARTVVLHPGRPSLRRDRLLYWKFLYNPDFGLIGAVLSAGSAFLARAFWPTRSQALPSLIATCVWKSWAFFMVIFLAGLKEIPRELYECAILEGASPWSARAVRHPPPPQAHDPLRGRGHHHGRGRKVFTPVFVMTDGGPRGATDLLVYFNWRTAFRLGDIGYASAMAVFMFVFVLAVNLVQLRVGGNGMRRISDPAVRGAGARWPSSPSLCVAFP